MAPRKPQAATASRSRVRMLDVEAWLQRMLERPSIQNLQGVTTQLLAGI